MRDTEIRWNGKSEPQIVENSSVSNETSSPLPLFRCSVPNPEKASQRKLMASLMHIVRPTWTSVLICVREQHVCDYDSMESTCVMLRRRSLLHFDANAVVCVWFNVKGNISNVLEVRFAWPWPYCANDNSLLSHRLPLRRPTPVHRHVQKSALYAPTSLWPTKWRIWLKNFQQQNQIARRQTTHDIWKYFWKRRSTF